jgi:hypothetical protein
MQILINCFEIKYYNLNSVIYFIEQFYPEYQYYSYYFRKFPVNINLYRFYNFDKNNNKKNFKYNAFIHFFKETEKRQNFF